MENFRKTFQSEFTQSTKFWLLIDIRISKPLIVLLTLLGLAFYVLTGLIPNPNWYMEYGVKLDTEFEVPIPIDNMSI
jgi:hypothetical protein